MECYFGHVGEMAVQLCSVTRLPYRPPPQLPGITYSSVCFGGSVHVWSSCLWSLISFLKRAIHNRNTLAALPLGVEKFCLQADIKNDPELPVLILMGNFLKSWCHRLSVITWDRGVWGMSIIQARAHLWGLTAELSQISRSVHLHFSDMAVELHKSFRPLILTCTCIWMHDTETQTSFIQTNLSSFQQGHGFLLAGCRGRAGSTKTHSSQYAAGTSARHWVYGTFTALPEIVVKENKRKLLGNAEPGVLAELARLAGVAAGLCPHPHVADWHHGVPKKNIPVS